MTSRQLPYETDHSLAIVAQSGVTTICRHALTFPLLLQLLLLCYCYRCRPCRAYRYCPGLEALEELDVAFTRVCDVGLMALAAHSPNLRR